ncbi:MAG: hypothetical protein EXR75_09580 [Myxococcales bacterium]|nr:hypothetical protein [Myxococcales bacterium]
MRSRYAAYVERQIEYLATTHEPKKRHEVDSAGATEWAEKATWEGLEIHATTGGADDAEATVEFTAKYAIGGRSLKHRERASFHKLEGRWYYHDGQMVKPPPVVRQEPKLGRNDPCHCASGVKFKKCCGR